MAGKRPPNLGGRPRNNGWKIAPQPAWKRSSSLLQVGAHAVRALCRRGQAAEARGGQYSAEGGLLRGDSLPPPPPLPRNAGHGARGRGAGGERFWISVPVYRSTRAKGRLAMVHWRFGGTGWAVMVQWGGGRARAPGVQRRPGLRRERVGCRHEWSREYAPWAHAAPAAVARWGRGGRQPHRAHGRGGARRQHAESMSSAGAWLHHSGRGVTGPAAEQRCDWEGRQKDLIAQSSR